MIKRALFAFLTVFVLTAFYSQNKAYAAGPDVACIGKAVGEYMKSVLMDPRLANVQNIQFLSPAFNMTETDFEGLAAAMKESAGPAWDRLDGIAGNAYNAYWGDISDFATRAKAVADGKPIMFTEVGWYPPDRKDAQMIAELKAELDKWKDDPQVLGMLLFNAFGDNPDPRFVGHVMTDEEIAQVCGGDCGSIGVNSAKFYGGAGAFYERAGNLGMGYTLEIANNDINASLPALEAAIDNGATPVIRLGVGDDGGGFEDPSALVDYILALDGQLNGTVYLIVGPNEALIEGWASPNCFYGDGINDPTAPGQDSAANTIDIIYVAPGANALQKDAQGRRLVTFRGKVTSTRIVKIEGLENDPETSNRPVWGATVCTYEGDGPTGSRGGKIPKPVDCGVTKQDGSFTVRALYAADTSVAGSNFLAICAGVRDNSKDCWLRELYLLSTRDSYDNFHFSIDAPPLIPKNKRINSVAQAPKELDYMNRENFLACETGTLKAGASAEKDGALNYTNKLFAKGGVVAPVLLLKKATDYYKETTWSPSSKAADDFPDAKEISGESLEGRLDAKKALDLRAVGELIHATVGTYFSEITTPKEGAAAEKLPTCQQLKECNETISSTTNKSNCNSQKSGAPGTHLASPITVRTLYYLISPTLRKKIPVCTEKGKTMFLSQVEPPWEYDPHHSKYPLSARYFPYQKLLTFDPAAIVKEREFVEATNDSYENDKGNVGGCRVVKFPDDSLFKKDGQRQDRAWADCDNSIHPATTGAELSTVMLNFLTTEKILAYSDIPEFGGPPTAALSTPTRPFGAKNPDLKTKFKGGYYRIGLQERLCNCSVTMDRNCADPINKIVFTTNEADTTNKYSSGYEFVTERSAETATAKGWLGWLNRKKGVEYFRDPINPVAKFIGFVYDMFTSWAANLGNWDKTYGACVNESQVAFCDTASDRYCRVETYTATSEDAGEYTETKYFTKLKTSPYQCSSEIKHPLNTRVEIPKTFNLDPGPSVQELYEPLTEPKVVSLRRQIGTIDLVDVEASNLEKAKDGYGGLHAVTTGTGAGVYSVEYVKRLVSDPSLTEVTYTAGTGPGSGTGGEDATINCTANAPDPGTTNAKPVEEVIAALNTSSFRADYSEENVRNYYNYVISTAKTAGMDPAFALATWIEESGASNYEAYPTVSDFGCVGGDWPTNNCSEQLRCATGLQYAYAQNSNHADCRDNVEPKGTMTVEKYMLIFSNGESGCLAEDFGPNPSYPDSIKEAYKIISGKDLNLNCTLPSTRWDSSCQ